MSSSLLMDLGPGYTVSPQTSPGVAINDAMTRVGVSSPHFLAQTGWGGPLHHLIHDPTVRDIWVQHGKVIARYNRPIDDAGDAPKGKVAQGIYLSDQWVNFLVNLWRNAYNDGAPVLATHNKLIFRSTLLFAGERGGIRYLYAPSAFSAYGTSLYIRRLPSLPMPLEDLVHNSTLTESAAETIRTLLRVGTPLIVSGQTGAGKTTMLGALVREIQSMFYPLNLLVIERSHELPLAKPAYRWELDPEGEVDLDHLAEKATQLGLEWFVIGECTGGEAYWAAKAYAQGVPVMTTLHANSSEAAFKRLAMLAIEHTQDPRLLPILLEDLGNQGIVSIHLDLKEREEGFLGAITGIDEMIGASETNPIVNPLWKWHEGGDGGAPGLRFNYGCVTQLSPGMRARFHAARCHFPVPPHEEEEASRRADDRPRKGRRGLFG